MIGARHCWLVVLWCFGIELSFAKMPTHKCPANWLGLNLTEHADVRKISLNANPKFPLQELFRLGFCDHNSDPYGLGAVRCQSAIVFKAECGTGCVSQYKIDFGVRKGERKVGRVHYLSLNYQLFNQSFFSVLVSRT